MNWKPYIVLLVAVLLMIGGLYLYSESGKPVGEDFSKAIELMPERTHIAQGTTTPNYNSNPPTSGPHYDKPAREKFYTEPLPDEHLVHNLEHGDIWLSYRASTTPEQALRVIKGVRDAKFIATPRENTPNDICIAAWGRLDCFDLNGQPFPEERLTDFIKRYKNKGPEQIDPRYQVNFN
jgi:hypothetical protein